MAMRRKRLVGFGEDQRIVRDAVRLDRQGDAGLAQDVQCRAHDLRLAAQAIGILHPRIVQHMAGADCRAGHERPQRRRRIDLALVPAKLVDSRIEGGIGSFGGFGRKRAGHQGRLEQPLGVEQTGQGIGR
jgi:hypothetical protein